MRFDACTCSNPGKDLWAAEFIDLVIQRAEELLAIDSLYNRVNLTTSFACEDKDLLTIELSGRPVKGGPFKSRVRKSRAESYQLFDQ